MEDNNFNFSSIDPASPAKLRRSKLAAELDPSENNLSRHSDYNQLTLYLNPKYLLEDYSYLLGLVYDKNGLSQKLFNGWVNLGWEPVRKEWMEELQTTLYDTLFKNSEMPFVVRGDHMLFRKNRIEARRTKDKISRQREAKLEHIKREYIMNGNRSVRVGGRSTLTDAYTNYYID